MDIARFELTRLNYEDFANRILHLQYAIRQLKVDKHCKIMVDVADPTADDITKALKFLDEKAFCKVDYVVVPFDFASDVKNIKDRLKNLEGLVVKIGS